MRRVPSGYILTSVSLHHRRLPIVGKEMNDLFISVSIVTVFRKNVKSAEKFVIIAVLSWMKYTSFQESGARSQEIMAVPNSFENRYRPQCQWILDCRGEP